MTDNERAILERLRALDDTPNPDGAYRYWPVSAVGGSTSTHHSTTLRRMMQPPKRWVDRRRRFEERPRGGLGWSITSAGRQALANDALTRKVRQHVV